MWRGFCSQIVVRTNVECSWAEWKDASVFIYVMGVPITEGVIACKGFQFFFDIIVLGIFTFGTFFVAVKYTSSPDEYWFGHW
jgi:hypothetical protein